VKLAAKSAVAIWSSAWRSGENEGRKEGGDRLAYHYLYVSSGAQRRI